MAQVGAMSTHDDPTARPGETPAKPGEQPSGPKPGTATETPGGQKPTGEPGQTSGNR